MARIIRIRKVTGRVNKHWFLFLRGPTSHGIGRSGVNSLEISEIISLAGEILGGESVLSEAVTTSEMPDVGSYAVVVYIPQ